MWYMAVMLDSSPECFYRESGQTLYMYAAYTPTKQIYPVIRIPKMCLLLFLVSI